MLILFGGFSSASYAPPSPLGFVEGFFFFMQNWNFKKTVYEVFSFQIVILLVVSIILYGTLFTPSLWLEHRFLCACTSHKMCEMCVRAEQPM